MDIQKELEKIIELKVDERIAKLENGLFLLKPWFKIDRVAEELDGKSTKWIRETFCSQELVDRGLVKKIGNEWHFRNPEFFNYIHDEWWERG